MSSEYFWKIIRTYNSLMESSISGPNCIDREVCSGNCCSIKIDVPKVLAKEYIRMNYAKKDDFIRSDIFSFQLRFDEKSGKCFLFDKQINGCRVHTSGIKPPQCWIYPTNFSNPKDNEISCKMASGWRILDFEKTKNAEILLKKYNFLCQIEANKELREIEKRIGNKPSKNMTKNLERLKKNIKRTAPSQLGGIKDGWDFCDILSAEGLSLQMKKFCVQYNSRCRYLQDNFFECKNICDIIMNKLIEFFQNNLYNYIKKRGLDTNGHYPLYKLFKFTNKEKSLR